MACYPCYEFIDGSLQVFVLDRQQFGTKTLINETLPGIQGLAFLVYNDAVFSEADSGAIRPVSQSSKGTDNEYVVTLGTPSPCGSKRYSAPEKSESTV